MAVFHAEASQSSHIECPGKPRAQRVAELTLEHFGELHWSGRLAIRNNIAEGKGCGSSTADCVAAARAVADALGQTLTPFETAQLVVAAETASDSIMFSSAVLFAHREGIVMEDYSTQLPSIEAVGIDTDPTGFVDTLAHPPAAYTNREIQKCTVLASTLRRAVQTRDCALLGRIATASAALNQRFLPNFWFPELRRLGTAVGALGVAAAHTGTVMSILFDAKDPQLERKSTLLLSELATLGFSSALRFCTNR
jgi:uncharacterized protein involved in propanediol utilization